MTSNQISAQQVRENERHNAAYEDETKRHNVETEKIESEKNYITQQYNEQSLHLQEAYNNRYLDYLEASEADKVNIETELNHIKYQQTLNEQWYKEQMSMWTGQQTEADTIYKDRLAAVAEMDSNIRAKQAYYESQKTEAYILDLQRSYELNVQRIENEKLRIMKDYELGLINNETKLKQLEIQDRQLELERTRWETQKANIESQTKKNKQETIGAGVHSAAELINSAANVVDSILPF